MLVWKKMANGTDHRMHPLERTECLHMSTTLSKPSSGKQLAASTYSMSRVKRRCLVHAVLVDITTLADLNVFSKVVRSKE